MAQDPIEKIGEAHRITKPIQLLAAWLVGLAAIDASFLGSAIALGAHTWLSSALILAAISNVWFFLGALILLQTRFRAEMQEDTFYSKYISNKTGLSVQIKKTDLLEAQIEELRSAFLGLKKETVISLGSLDWRECRVAVNDYLPFYSEIVHALLSAKIPKASIFGRINGVANPPAYKIIVISESVSARFALPVLKVCTQFSFDGYSMREKIQGIDEDDIYIGSYGQRDNLVKFSQEVIEKISIAVDEADYKLLFF